MEPQNLKVRVKKSKNRTTRYTFTEVIGRGNYSRIWKATDNQTQKIVAIKEIHKNITSMKRFYKELAYSKMVRDHANIGKTHGFLHETESAYFMVQDFAAGGDLCTWIAAHGQLEENIAKIYFHQICTAVQHMHSLNLVHLDIKPDNILLKDTTGKAVELVDFGMTERSGKRLSTARGTLPYMAPEIFDLRGLPVQGLKVVCSLDMWSLGVVLFSMLTGNFPWMQATLTDPDYAEFYRWQVGGSLSSPEEWRAFSPEICRLLRSLLIVDPKCRCKIHEVFGHDFLKLDSVNPKNLCS